MAGISPDPAAPPPSDMRPGGPYAWYVLLVLTIVYVVNFVDRSILTVAGPYVQRDLGLSDAQLGLLSGTAFALFYGLFGLVLGGLADSWSRTRMIALGLGLWSAMTALSGFATSFGQLAAARVGVGVGEASASPAAHSLIGDWFPRERRATALAIYSSGVFIGAGFSYAVSGLVIARWDTARAAGTAFWELAGWQVAFLCVGLPGLLLAMLVLTLKEPVRGQAEGLSIALAPKAHPFRQMARDLATIIPPFTLLALRRSGAPPGAIRANSAVLLVTLAALVVMTAASDGLTPAAHLKPLAWIGPIPVSGNFVQWAAMAIGLYGVYSWSQALKLRDPPLHGLILGSPALLLIIAAATLMTLTSYGVGAWVFVYAFRTLGATPAEAGVALGLGWAIGGWIGSSVGGIVGDLWQARDPGGRLKLAIIAALMPIPIVLTGFTTHSITIFYLCYFLYALVGTLWLGGLIATLQDLVLPRMRGTVAAVFVMSTTLIALGNGPYLVGLVSDASGNLRAAILLMLLAEPLAGLCLWLAIRKLPGAISSVSDRARCLGERI